jgi:hypothetical protein
MVCVHRARVTTPNPMAGQQAPQAQPLIPGPVNRTLTAYLNDRVVKRWPYKLLNDWW